MNHLVSIVYEPLYGSEWWAYVANGQERIVGGRLMMSISDDGVMTIPLCMAHLLYETGLLTLLGDLMLHKCAICLLVVN